MLSVASMFVSIMAQNRVFYIIAFAYSLIVTCLFLFVLKKDSIAAQLIIYLSISMLFAFGGLITQGKPDSPSTTFIVLLLITPMFMIDKPFFMAIELVAASIVFLIWMRYAKTYDAWKVDSVNVVVFSLVGIFIHVISNSLRIKEFVLSRQLSIQRDTDELTGLKNKSAVTKEINAYPADDTKDKGIMLLLDINHFKYVNDTYGHDVGDSVIRQFGRLLGSVFTDEAIVGRFGGDEFIVFIKDTDETAAAEQAAKKILDGAAASIKLPDGGPTISAGIGIAVYHGLEKNYSEIFKKADVALYRTKTDRTIKYDFYTDSASEAEGQPEKTA